MPSLGKQKVSDGQKLWLAAKRDDLKTLVEIYTKWDEDPLVEGGDLLRWSDKKYGRTALEIAAQHGRVDIVTKLLDLGADVGGVDGEGDCNTPLHYAAMRGHRTVVHVLLMRGANIYSLNRNNHSPLDLARIHGKVNSIQRLERELRLYEGWLLVKISSRPILKRWHRTWCSVIRAGENNEVEIVVYEKDFPRWSLIMTKNSCIELSFPKKSKIKNQFIITAAVQNCLSKSFSRLKLPPMTRTRCAAANDEEFNIMMGIFRKAKIQVKNDDEMHSIVCESDDDDTEPASDGQDNSGGESDESPLAKKAGSSKETIHLDNPKIVLAAPEVRRKISMQMPDDPAKEESPHSSSESSEESVTFGHGPTLEDVLGTPSRKEQRAKTNSVQEIEEKDDSDPRL